MTRINEMGSGWVNLKGALRRNPAPQVAGSAAVGAHLGRFYGTM